MRDRLIIELLHWVVWLRRDGMRWDQHVMSYPLGDHFSIALPLTQEQIKNRKDFEAGRERPVRFK